MGGVCPSHSLSPIAHLGFNLGPWMLELCESGNGGVLWCFVVCRSFVSFFSVVPYWFVVCSLYVVFLVGCLGWVGCSFGTLEFCIGYILWFLLGFLAFFFS